MVCNNRLKLLLVVSVLFITMPSLLLAKKVKNCKTKFGGKDDTGTCMAIRDCKGAALEPYKKDCDKNTICCVNDRTVTIAEDKRMTKSTFLKLVGNTPRNDAMYNYFVQSMPLASVSSGANVEFKMCAFLAQIVGESKVFERMESRYVDSDKDADFGNSDAGDGEKYQGRGGLYVRGKKDYEACAKANNIYSINN